ISLTAIDNCGETITVDGVDTTVPGACANTFTTTRTWTFVDACGNESSVSQVISVVDNIPPADPIKIPTDMTVDCIENVPGTFELSITVNCVEVLTAIGVDTFHNTADCNNEATVVRTWTFTDSCGNSNSITQVFYINDNIAPVFNTETPEDVTVSCDAIPEPAVMTAVD